MEEIVGLTRFNLIHTLGKWTENWETCPQRLTQRGKKDLVRFYVRLNSNGSCSNILTFSHTLSITPWIPSLALLLCTFSEIFGGSEVQWWRAHAVETDCLDVDHHSATIYPWTIHLTSSPQLSQLGQNSMKMLRWQNILS